MQRSASMKVRSSMRRTALMPSSTLCARTISGSMPKRKDDAAHSATWRSEAREDFDLIAGKQWSQQLGPSLALFDVAAAALKGASDPKDKQALAKAISTADAVTPIGHIQFGKGPNANVVATPIIGGQWVSSNGGTYPLDFVLCENSSDPNVPVAAQLKPYA